MFNYKTNSMIDLSPYENYLDKDNKVTDRFEGKKDALVVNTIDPK